MNVATAEQAQASTRETLIRVLSAITFLIFFQAFMVAPLLPRLAAEMGTSAERAGWIVPAYLVPYGLATLIYGVLSDRIGRRTLILASLAAFVVLTALTATARSIETLFMWRLLTGIGASAVVPLSLSLMASLFPYEKRGRPLGWLFGAMAGGMAFGSTVGAVLYPLIGWRGLFLGVAGAALLALVALLPHRALLGGAVDGPKPTAKQVARATLGLLRSPRGARTYAYVFVNAIFHSGVFTWLGLYFESRHHLGEVGIGLALLGYGVPGFIFGPAIGRLADRSGRRRLVPIGIAIAAVAGAALIFEWPVVVAAMIVTLLSLGYEMTQPLLAGIVTTLDPPRAGLAMGINVLCLFVGFGVGSAAFGALLRSGWTTALAVFAGVLGIGAILAVPLFRGELSARGGAQR